MKKAFVKADHAGTLSWKKGGVVESHLGVRFARVDLGPLHTGGKRDDSGNKDGFRYAAFIPLGALTPTAPEKDPNKVREFYVERTGGQSSSRRGGATETTGPLSL